ncbi:Tip elongation aberrant protein 1 [Thelohanellus kitauei]|uniref:Tip elongation aberrant protein 1 n=1 Tax=Thelohanellus kitauei TaxID=669202 RepID=A0A0C2JZ21_THEKT|nr:Tip elongation aberrant protein 1 [Thelohanellus kitauei]
MMDGLVDDCMTSIGALLIIYGGFSNVSEYHQYDLLIYNTVSGIWKRYSLPDEIKNTPLSSSICAVGKLIYLFGGVSREYQFRETNSLLSFDISSATWEILFPHTNDYDQNTPPPMSQNLLLYHDRSLYTLGSNDGNEEFYAMYEFNLKTSTWSLVPHYGLKPPYNLQIFGTIFKNR